MGKSQPGVRARTVTRGTLVGWVGKARPQGKGQQGDRDLMGSAIQWEQDVRHTCVKWSNCHIKRAKTKSSEIHFNIFYLICLKHCFGMYIWIFLQQTIFNIKI